jgi:hypothetical protein
MWTHKKILSTAFAIAIFVSCWSVPLSVLAQTKANVPKPQNTLALGEDAVKHLLLLMNPDKNGKISKQAWMRFMGEEFDRLDKDKNGELDAQELRRLNAPIKHTPRTIGRDQLVDCRKIGVQEDCRSHQA